VTPEEINMAVAELCGYVWYRLPDPRYQRDAMPYRMLAHPAIHEYPEQSAEWRVRANGTERICNWEYMKREGHVPDYFRDVNACLTAIENVPSIAMLKNAEGKWQVRKVTHERDEAATDWMDSLPAAICSFVLAEKPSE
jgi:hypothetical protein